MFRETSTHSDNYTNEGTQIHKNKQGELHNNSHIKECKNKNIKINTRLHSPPASVRIQSSKWVCLQSVCCWVRLAQSVPLLLSTFAWQASELPACVLVCVSLCHSTPLSRHAALLLPQYACSRIPAPLFIFSSPHHNPYLSLFLSVMDLLAVLPPLSEVKYKPRKTRHRLVH